MHRQILSREVKFPLLEYCGHELFKAVGEEEQIQLCDQIEALKTEGGNVLLGIILQNRLSHHFKESLQKTTAYISKADIWYVCDIIGESVFGYALLQYSDKTIPEIKKHFPCLEEKYQKFFSRSNEMPFYYRDAFYKKMKELCEEYKLKNGILEAAQ